MNTSQPLRIAFLCLTLLLAGCAQPKMVMNLADTGQGYMPKVWPAPPEKARYRYVGELTGEENFRTNHGATMDSTANALKWLIGMIGENPNPVVLQRPQSGVVDAEGRVYVTDVNRQAVFVFDKVAGELNVWEAARLNTAFRTPIGIALGARDEILVTDAMLHTVLRMDKKGNPLGEFGRDLLQRPTGVARDAKRGRVYVADTYGHDIKVFDDNGNFLETIGRRGTGDGEFNFPTHMTFAADKLYVTDTLNSRIQIFDANGKMIQKFGQLGMNVGDLVRPKGIAVDNAGHIYVIESLYDTLLVFNDQGQTLMGLGGTGKNAGEFFLPAGVWTDSRDQVYIADMFNGRITVLQFLGAK